jgi:diguanylate cyclase (GGDEF)-like protein
VWVEAYTMAARGDGETAAAARGQSAVRALLGRPFANLPAKIITAIFATTLSTSIAVSYIAAQSTEAFLRGKIDERFPVVLGRTAERVDAWYAQRELDLVTFARSGIVIDGASAIADAQTAAEAGKYLGYVREGFPQYRALFILSATGELRVWVGRETPLPQQLLERLAQADPAAPSVLARAGGEPVQFLSTPIEGAGGLIGSLHVMIGVDSIRDLLHSDDLEETARVFLLSPKGEVVAATRDLSSGLVSAAPVPEGEALGEVRDYLDAEDNHVVGAAHDLGRFGWTLVLEDSYEAAFAPVVSLRRRVIGINIGIVLAFGTLAFLIARSIAGPIRALSEGARRIANGETDVELPEAGGRDEIGVLSRVFSEMVEKLNHNREELERKQAEVERANLELVEANEELKRGNEVLEQLSFTDGLTRLHNHRYFQDRLRVEARRCDRNQEPLALLLLDIDDFKALNDRHGHAGGDAVLQGVGSLLNRGVRDSDLPARYGGEEFAILAPNTDGPGALALAEKLRSAIAEARFESDAAKELSVTTSVGVAIYAGDTRALFNEADRALYRAKAEGKDCVVCAWDLEEATGEDD